MTQTYFTITAEDLASSWRSVIAGQQGVKPVRQYENQVLFTIDPTGESTLRIANDTCAIVASLNSIEVATKLSAAILPEDLGPAIERFTGIVRVEPDTDGHRLLFRSDTLQQIVSYQADDQFPNLPNATGGDNLLDTEGAMLAKRLRIASSAGEASYGTMYTGGVFIKSNGEQISMMSANPVRGVTRLLWNVQVPAFQHLVPIVNLNVVAKIAAKSESVSISGGDENRLVFGFDDKVWYYCRSMGQVFYQIEPMFAGETHTKATVERDLLMPILRLIGAKNDPPLTTIVFDEDLLDIASKSGAERSVIKAVTGGHIGTSIRVNAKQLLEIAADLNTKEGVIDLMIQQITPGKYALRVEVPGLPEFLHIAVPYVDK